jgi:hypothetical protein
MQRIKRETPEQGYKFARGPYLSGARTQDSKARPIVVKLYDLIIELRPVRCRGNQIKRIPIDTLYTLLCQREKEQAKEQRWKESGRKRTVKRNFVKR